jgi:outer membrane protein TolC
MNKFCCFILALSFLMIHEHSSSGQGNNLEFFISQGIIHSPVLKDLANQAGSNSFDSLLIKAGQKPQVSFNGLLYYAPVINGIGYSDVITNISNITSVVYASQHIFNQKTIEAQYSKFGIQNQAIRISSKITENELKKAITLQYLSACSVSNEISVNKELLASAQDEQLILKQLVEKGLYKQVDYNLFMLEYKAQELLLKDLDIQYRKEISSLNILCGLPDEYYEHIELPDILLNPAIDKDSSPLFKRYIVDSLKIQNEKLLIDRNYKPSVNWFSDAGLLNNLPRDISRNFGFSVGLSLTFPIYDGQQRTLNYNKLKLAEDTRTNYAYYFNQQFNQQQKQLFNELKQTQEIIPQVEQQLSFAESVINQDKYLLNSGNISITDYILALKNYISVKRNLSIYRVKILQIITELNYWNQ